MSQLKGKLTLTIHKARDLQDKQLIGKQDPYCVVTIGDEQLKTKVHDGGGTSAVWEQSLLFNLDSQRPDVHIKIWDRETLVDRQIGRADIPVLEMIKNKGPEWYSLVDQNNFKKIAGYVQISTVFEGTGAPAPRTPVADSRTINYNENRAPSPAFNVAPSPQAQIPIMQQQQPQPIQQQPIYQQQYQPQPILQQAPPTYYAPAPVAVQPVIYAPPAAFAPVQVYQPNNSPAFAPSASASASAPHGSGSGSGSGPAAATGKSEWACKACTFWNKPSQKMRCEMCDTPFQS